MPQEGICGSVGCANKFADGPMGIHTLDVWLLVCGGTPHTVSSPSCCRPTIGAVPRAFIVRLNCAIFPPEVSDVCAVSLRMRENTKLPVRYSATRKNTFGPLMKQTASQASSFIFRPARRSLDGLMESCTCGRRHPPHTHTPPLSPWLTPPLC